MKICCPQLGGHIYFRSDLRLDTQIGLRLAGSPLDNSGAEGTSRMPEVGFFRSDAGGGYALTRKVLKAKTETTSGMSRTRSQMHRHSKRLRLVVPVIPPSKKMDFYRIYQKIRRYHPHACGQSFAGPQLFELLAVKHCGKIEAHESGQGQVVVCGTNTPSSARSKGKSAKTSNVQEPDSLESASFKAGFRRLEPIQRCALLQLRYGILQHLQHLRLAYRMW